MRALVLGLSLVVGSCATLVVPNPTTVSFDYADGQTAARFEGGYFTVPLTAGGTCDTSAVPTPGPVTVDDLGNPYAGVAPVTALLKARPLGCYVYRVRAFDRSGLVSPWGAPSGRFQIRVP